MKLRPATEEHASLPAFDNTKLVAINTCPVWGILRYEHHKVFSHNSRAMALEAGGACHQVFAALRFADLFMHGAEWYGNGAWDQATYEHGVRLFGEDNYKAFMDHLKTPEDKRTRLINVALTAFEQTGFYDDPRDKRRTVNNIQEALIAYTDRYPFGKHLPVVAEIQGKWFVGIEIPFELAVYPSPNIAIARFTGRIDGVHFYDRKMDMMEVADNKTASRIDEAWENSFELAHQMTGYLRAVHTITGFPVTRTRIHGLALPLPRSYDFGGVSTVINQRKPHQFDEWDKWFLHTYHIWKQYKDKPHEAPQYTHSCNRYFRSCSYIPYCALPPEERLEAYEEMVVEEWSPLHGSTESS